MKRKCGVLAVWSEVFLSAGPCKSKWLGVWALSPGLPFAACDRASCCSLPILVPFCERGNEVAEGVSPGPGSWKTWSQCELPHSNQGGCPRVSAQSYRWGLLSPALLMKKWGLRRLTGLLPTQRGGGRVGAGHSATPGKCLG